MFRFERGLCPRNRFLGEVSEGAVEAPSEETPQMGPFSSLWGPAVIGHDRA